MTENQKIALALGIIVALAGAGYGLYYYTRKKDARNQFSFEK